MNQSTFFGIGFLLLASMTVAGYIIALRKLGKSSERWMYADFIIGMGILCFFIAFGLAFAGWYNLGVGLFPQTR